MTGYKVRAGEVEEDNVTSWIESYTAQIPSSAYLIAAGAAIIGSSRWLDSAPSAKGHQASSGSARGERDALGTPTRQR